MVDTRVRSTIATLILVEKPGDDLGDDPGDDEQRDEHDDLDRSPPLSADAQMIDTARRRYGSVGAIVAGGMLGLDRILGRKVKEEAPVVWEASGEPEDIDRGMTIDIDDDTTVVSTPRRARPRVIHRRRNNVVSNDSGGSDAV